MIRCRHAEAIHLVLIADDLSFFLESVTNSETILQISLSMTWIDTIIGHLFMQIINIIQIQKKCNTFHYIAHTLIQCTRAILSTYYPDYVSTIQAPQSGVDIRDFIQLLLKSLVLPPEPAAYPPTVIKRGGTQDLQSF